MSKNLLVRKPHEKQCLILGILVIPHATRYACRGFYSSYSLRLVLSAYHRLSLASSLCLERQSKGQ